ncbi:MAG: YicC family protein, partial [Clostridia bacterium]|nr:YicC family protein [Clostridia bacterium]
MKSMTGFGRASASGANRDYTVEIRSVNGRYFDCSVRLPRDLLALEERVRGFVREKAQTRGKIDVTVSFARRAGSENVRTVDTDYVRSYLDALYRLRDEFNLPDDISVMRVAADPGVFVSSEEAIDPDAEWASLLPALSGACEAHTAMRTAEGKKIADDLSAKLSFVSGCVEKISGRSEENIGSFRERFENRLRQILSDERITPDENRILTECAIYADRVAIDEEIVRLRSHISAFSEIAGEAAPSGKKLDFLLQEMNREINTVGSKCADAGIARLVVTVKNELEKIREQIQNIE